MAAPSAEDIQLAREALSPELMVLFLQMQPSDQVHSLKIFKALRRGGEISPDLLAAALLHDVGKSRCRLTPWERGFVVIFRRIAPKLADSWGKSELMGWKKPFVVYACHPQWGADLVQAGGGNPLVVDLIRRHQQSVARDRQERIDPRESSYTLSDDLLLQLQRLDNES